MSAKTAPDVSEFRVEIANPTRARSPIFDLDEFFAQPEPEWMVPHWFYGGNVGMIFGSSSAGKTFFVVDTLVRLAKGLGPCGFDLFKPAQPMHVLLLTDEGVYDLRKRVQASVKRHGIHQGHPAYERIHLRTAVTQLYKQDLDYNVEELTDYLDELKEQWGCYPGIIVADHLQNSARGAKLDSSNDDAAVIMANAKKIADHIGGAYYLVHHTPKTKGDLPRGAQNLYDASDHIVLVEGDDGPRTVTCSKLKAAAKWKMSRQFNILSDEDSAMDNAGVQPAYIEWAETGVKRKKSTTEKIDEDIREALRGLDARDPDSAVIKARINEFLGDRLNGTILADRLNDLSNDPYSGVKRHYKQRIRTGGKVPHFYVVT